MQKVSDSVELTTEELYRADVLQECRAGRLSNGQAAERLGISVRQVKRLKHRLQLAGVKGLASKQRGRPSHNQLPPDTLRQARTLLRTHYADFGPTFAHEKLVEVHHLQLSPERVRQLMIAEGLWKPHRAHKPVIHPLRERRPRRGELVQIDGSPFDWFEGRAPACTLLVFIDDATGQLLELFFAAAETTHSYFQATEHYLRQHGRPVTFYSDKFGVFRINHPHVEAGEGMTQFARAMYELDITLICANTPQAKGRVERVNQTLQDRLVKELRLQEISDLPAANAYLPAFRADFNRRFAVMPRDPTDAHRPLRVADDLTRILALRELRTLSKNLTLSYNNVIYQIQTNRPGYALRQAQVEVRERWDGQIAIFYKGRPLNYTLYREPPKQAELITSKMLNPELDAQVAAKKKRKVYVPPKDHPWRKFRISNQADQPKSPEG
jgi:transposase